MSSDTQSRGPSALDTEGPGPARPEAAPRALGGGGGRPPGGFESAGWWLAAIVFVALAAWAGVVVARGTHPTTGHRAAAAWVALLIVVALAVLVQAILLWYQAPAGRAPGRRSGQTRGFRRRGLKSAVMGLDGRASTSKTQVALWTAAVVWALADLLLLARAYHGGQLFTSAVTTNWRPEYLVLLGLPAAAATAAKAIVTTTNSGRGPLPARSSGATAASLGLTRVYQRDHVSDGGAQGFVTGVAELLTGDDGTVAWADLQYVVFTLITLVYFVAQFLARPMGGLPPVPAALLTLMGVSATTYTANKVVNTRGVNPN